MEKCELNNQKQVRNNPRNRTSYTYEERERHHIYSQF